MNNSAQRRSGRRDQQARKALESLVESGAATCRRCGLPIKPGESWDAGHLDDLALGGSPSGRVAPEHASCNRAAGARLGMELRADRRRRGRRLDAWLRSAPIF